MAEVITSRQLGILAFIAKNPGAPMAAIVKGAGATAADLAYLGQHDMIREQREGGSYRIAHFGELVLKRGL
jgi:hypothetical protein